MTLPDPFAATLKDWQVFFQMSAECAATLTGLMFIAFTVGTRVLSASAGPAIHTFISPTLGHFTTVILVSGLMCIPSQTRPWLTAEMCVLGLFGLYRLGAVFRNLRRWHQRRAFSGRTWALNAAVLMSACFCLLGTAAGLALNRPWAFSVLSAGVLMLIVVGIINAWEATFQSILVKPEDIVTLQED